MESDQHRHECEVRDVLRRYYPDEAEARGYLRLVLEKRGKEAAQRLGADVRKAWDAKNLT